MKHDEIRMKRLKARISQKELAAKVGISSPRLCFYELYGVELPPFIVVKMERILGGGKEKRKRISRVR